MRIRLSQRKLANLGRAYSDRFLGLAVLHRTADGEELRGVVSEFRNGYPVIRFADGRWARGDLALLPA